MPRLISGRRRDRKAQLLTNQPTRRDRVFNLMIMSDPLLSRIDLFLREKGHSPEADHLLQLQQDIGVEQFNDSFVNDGKDFGEGDAVGEVSKYWEPRRPDFETITDPLLAAYTSVTLERFAVLGRIAQIFENHPGDMAADFTTIYAEFNRILSGQTPMPSGGAPVIPPPGLS